MALPLLPAEHIPGAFNALVDNLAPTVYAHVTDVIMYVNTTWLDNRLWPAHSYKNWNWKYKLSSSPAMNNSHIQTESWTLLLCLYRCKHYVLISLVNTLLIYQLVAMLHSDFNKKLFIVHLLTMTYDSMNHRYLLLPPRTFSPLTTMLPRSQDRTSHIK